MESSEPSAKRVKMTMYVPPLSSLFYLIYLQLLTDKPNRESFCVPLKIVVGKDKTEFYISKHLICKRSEFFKAACNDQWESGRTNTVTLEEDDPKIFSIFLTWLSTGNVKDAAEFLPFDKEDKDASFLAFDQLVKCFILGNVLGALPFRNKIADFVVLYTRLFLDTHKSIVGAAPDKIQYIWSNTVDGSPLREIVLDNYVAKIGRGHVSAMSSVAGLSDFYCNVAQKAILCLRTTKTPLPSWKKTLCTYHEHPDQLEGYDCAGPGGKLKER